MSRGLKQVDVEKRVKEMIADDVGVGISMGNTKLHNIPNLSLTPVDTCPGYVKECEYCYAVHSCNFSPSARARWAVNTFYAKNAPMRFRDDVAAHIYLSRTEWFRIHVGGDFFSQEYVNVWSQICERLSNVRFLAFSKSFPDLTGLDFTAKPANLVLMWSVFPSSDMRKIPDGPRAWTTFERQGIDYHIRPEDEARLENAHECAGTCNNCGMCFFNDTDPVDVKFTAHGRGSRRHERRE